MKVLKFGGYALDSAENILRVKDIIKSQNEQVIVVVSAFYGITDKLLELSRRAAAREENFFRLHNEIEIRHTDIVNALFAEPLRTEVMTRIDTILKDLISIINGVYQLNDLTPKIQDRILSFGEIMSSYIISKIIKYAEVIDAKGLIKTDDRYGKAKVNFPLSNRLIRAQFNNYKKTGVVPGFIASSEHNVVTTLGRGGSDYTAAIISAALDVERLEIWTNVDGFMTADPRKVEKAMAIDYLSYAEAMELSHFGAEVIYTPTIHPVYNKNIEVVIKNIFNPEGKGTLISKESKSAGASLIKGISSIDDIDLITLQGAGMVGVKGISSRLFGALARIDVNIILITQASSEYSISFALSPGDSEQALKALETEFEPEIKNQKRIKCYY